MYVRYLAFRKCCQKCVCKGQCSGSLRQLFELESLEVLRTGPLPLVISNRVPQPVGKLGQRFLMDALQTFCVSFVATH